MKKQQELDEAAKQQQEPSSTLMSNGTSSTSPGRQVGMKSKRDEDEGDDDVEWEEAPVAGIYHYLTICIPILKLIGDLNI